MLNMNGIIDISVSTTQTLSAESPFSKGLIFGKNTIISEVIRIKEYTSVDAMLVDEFLVSDSITKSAILYFAQSPKPQSILIGTWGALEAIEVGLAACREASTEWLNVHIVDAVKQNILDAALYAETASPDTIIFATTKDADVLTKTAGNVAEALMEAKYSKIVLQFSSTDNASAAIMGYACGASLGTIAAAFTLQFKSEVGVTAGEFDNTEASNMLSNNCNFYAKRTVPAFFSPGVVSNGTFYDEMLGLARLRWDINNEVLRLFSSTPKVAQTTSGVTQLISAISVACVASLNRSFIAPGVWNGETILNLKPGDTLPRGFLVQAEEISSQSQVDREARKAPPIYVSIKLAGAVHSVTIVVNVNR